MLPNADRLPEITREGANLCFACGQENPIGLKLKFKCSEGKAEAEFTPIELYQGWPGVLHGGIICTILDEAMGYTVYPQGLNCITAKAEVRFKRPVPIGQPLIIKAQITNMTKRLVETKASIALKDGTELAEGISLMYVVSEEPSSPKV